MMSGYRTICCLLIFSLLAGCATRGLPNDPREQGLWYVNQAAEQMKLGNLDRATGMLVNAVSKPGGAEATQSLLGKTPENVTKLTDYYEALAKESNDKEMLISLASSLNAFVQAGVFSKASEIKKQLENRAALTNETGEVAWNLTDDVKDITTLQADKSKEVMFRRTVQSLSSASRNVDAANAIAIYIMSGKCSSANALLAENAVKNTQLRKSELQCFEKIYPKIVADKLASLTAYIKLSVAPQDRLFEEDLKGKLGSYSENFVFLGQTDATVKNVYSIVIERHRSEERQMQPQTRTVSYPQHEVNTFAAVMLMPRDSTYMYEYSSGGIEIEYGYTVKVSQGGKVFLDELVRGTKRESYVSCANKRIVNVFGGVSGATFIANDDMKRNCANASDNVPSIQLLRAQVIDILARKAASAEPLRSRIE